MKKLTLGFAALIAIVAFGTTTLIAGDKKCSSEKPGKCNSEKPGKCSSDRPGKCGTGKCSSDKPKPKSGEEK